MEKIIKWIPTPYFLALYLIFLPQVMYSQNIITFFIRKFPDQTKKTVEDSAKKISQASIPGKVTSKILQKNLLKTDITDGIFATYGGRITVSSANGQITFPRRHQKPEVKLLITPSIKPIFMLGKVIHHWEINQPEHSQMYKIERKFDTDTQMYYWQATKEPLPEGNRIPVAAIVLFAKAKNVTVPLGATITNKSTQLVLPDIYVRKELNSPARALSALKYKIFFEPLEKKFKKESPVYYSRQVY